LRAWDSNVHKDVLGATMHERAEPQVTEKTRVFISYSRKDADFRERLAAALELRGYTAVYDQSQRPHDDPDLILSPQDEWWNAIKAMIAACDVMIFVVTPESAASRVCDDEIAHARSLGRRVIPVLRRQIDFAASPERLRALNVQLDFQDDDETKFRLALDELALELDRDIEWHRAGVRLTRLANEWERRGKAEGLLLGSVPIADADAWLARRPKNAEAPGALLLAYLEQSRSKEIRDKRRLQRITGLAYARSVNEFAEKGRHHEAMVMTAVGAIVADDLNFEAAPELWDAGASSIVANPIRLLVVGEQCEKSWSRSRACLSSNEKWLALSVADGSVDIWDAETGEKKSQLAADLGCVLHLAFVRQDQLLIAAGETGAVVAWDVASGELVSELRQPERIAEPNSMITGIAQLGAHRLSHLADEMRRSGASYPEIVTFALSQDKRHLLIGTMHGLVELWDCDRMYPLWTRKVASPALSGDLSSDSKWAVVPSANGTIHLLDASTGVESRASKAPHDFVWQTKFSPDGSVIAVISNRNSYANPFAPSSLETGVVEIRDAATLDVIYRAAEPSGFITPPAFSPDSSTISFGMEASGVFQSDIRMKTRAQPIPGPVTTDAVSVAYSGDGNQLASLSANEVVVWNTASKHPVFRLKTDYIEPSECAFSTDSRLILVSDGYDRHTATLIDWAPSPVEREYDGASAALTAIDVNPSRQEFLTTDVAGRLTIWDFHSGSALRTLQAAYRHDFTARYSEDGERIIGRSDDNDDDADFITRMASVQVWHSNTGELVGSIAEHGTASMIRLSPAGDLALFKRRLVDLVTCKEIVVIDGRDPSFSDDGKWIVAISDDKADTPPPPSACGTNGARWSPKEKCPVLPP
jgi:WD40 repeat protein